MTLATVQSASSSSAQIHNAREAKEIPAEGLAILKSSMQTELQRLQTESSLQYSILLTFYEEFFPAAEDLSSILKNGYKTKIGGQRRNLTPENSIARLLFLLTSLRTLFQDCLSTGQETIFIKQLAHFLAVSYCRLTKREDSSFLAIPIELTLNDECKRFVLCAKDDEKWTVDIRATGPNKSTNYPIHLSSKRCLMVDEKNLPLERSCIMVSTGLSPRHVESKKLWLNRYDNPAPLSDSDEFTMFFDVLYYAGDPRQFPKHNSIYVTGTLDSNKQYSLDPQDKEGVTEPWLAGPARKFASAYIDWKKDTLIEEIKKEPDFVHTYFLWLPNAYEFQTLESKIVKEIAKNPEGYVDAIEYLLEASDLTTSAEIESKEEEELFVTPQKGVELLLEAFPSSQESSIDSKLVQEDKERRREIEKQSVSTTKKAPRPKNHKHQKKPQNKKSLVLTDKERSQVRQVMQGNSMKVDEFVKFSLALLNKKVGTDGSAEKKTLVRMQRKRKNDLQGKVYEQKSFLKTLLKS